MKRMLRSLIVALCVALSAPLLASAQNEKESSRSQASSDTKELIRAAIFVQNNAGPMLDESVDTFRDLLTARLAEKGFSILDSHDVIASFQETKRGQDPVDTAIEAVTKVVKAEKSESSVEKVLTGASALRISQLLHAHYLIVATLASVGTEKRTFNGEGTLYKTSNGVTIRTLRVSLRVLEGNQGGTVYGDTVLVSQRVGGPSRLEVVTDGVNDTLIDNAAAKIADNISSKVERIRNVKVESTAVTDITITSNVEGATVEIDGVVVGSAPNSFAIAPGLHPITVSKEWYTTWSRTINVVGNQTINVTLERSKEGEARYAESLRTEREDQIARKKADAEIAVAKEQSEAAAFALRQVAEGEKEFRKNSHTQIEGNVDNLSVGEGPSSIIKVERE